MTPEQEAFFRKNGYLMIEDAIVGDDLKRVQETFLEGQAVAREKWGLDEKVNDPMCRQLLGLERVSGGNPYVPKVA